MEYLEAHAQACAASLRKPLVISEFGFAVAKGRDVGRRLQYLTLVRRIWKGSLATNRDTAPGIHSNCLHVADKTHAHSIFSHDFRCQVLNWFKERQNIVAGVLAWQLVDNEYKSQYYEGEPLSFWEMDCVAWSERTASSARLQVSRSTTLGHNITYWFINVAEYQIAVDGDGRDGLGVLVGYAGSCSAAAAY